MLLEANVQQQNDQQKQNASSILVPQIQHFLEHSEG